MIGLSYEGDLRTWVKAESKNKREKIFYGNENGFLKLYKPIVLNQCKKHGLGFIENSEGRLKLECPGLAKTKGILEETPIFRNMSESEAKKILEDPERQVREWVGRVNLRSSLKMALGQT